MFSGKRERSSSPSLSLSVTVSSSADTSPDISPNKKARAAKPSATAKGTKGNGRTTIKAEPDTLERADEISNSSDDENYGSPTAKGKGKGAETSKSRGRPGSKARIQTEAKRIIARYLLDKGASVADVQELVQLTGLSAQQIRSQLVGGRQNVRRQMEGMIDAAQL